MDVHCMLATGQKQVKRTVFYKQNKSFRNQNRKTNVACVKILCNVFMSAKGIISPSS